MPKESDTTHELVLTVGSAHGLHMRPAALIANALRELSCEVRVVSSGKRANGKSVVDLLGLEAWQGAELRFEIRGRDAGQALDALRKLDDV